MFFSKTNITRKIQKTSGIFLQQTYIFKLSSRVFIKVLELMAIFIGKRAADILVV